MKKLVLTIITLSSISILNAQKIKFGAKGGLNSSTMTYEIPVFGELNYEVYRDKRLHDYTVGFHLGGFVEFRLTDQFFFQPELLLSVQGSKYEYKYIGGGGYSGVSFMTTGINRTKVTTTYITIPLISKYYVSKKLFLIAGPQVGFLIKAKSISEDSSYSSVYTYNYSNHTSTETTIINPDVSTELNLKDSFTAYNISANAGIGYFFTENIFAEGRYILGLTNDSQSSPFFNDSKFLPFIKTNPTIMASVFQVSVGYRF